MPDVTLPVEQGVTQYVQTTLKTATDADGAVSFLDALWNRGDVSDLNFAVVGVFPTSSAGSWSSLGNITATNPGIPFPAGGLYIYLLSAQDVRNFRIQAAAGGTLTFTGTAYR